MESGKTNGSGEVAKWVFLAIAIAVLFVVALGGGIMYLLRSSGAHELALQAASGDPRVTSVTGRPIETGFWVLGNIRVTQDSGTANLRIPISGPAGAGHLHVAACKSRGQWSLQRLLFTSGDEAAIDLIAQPGWYGGTDAASRSTSSTAESGSTADERARSAPCV